MISIHFHPFTRRHFLRATLVAAALGTLSASAVTAAPKSYPYNVTTTVGMVNDIVRNVAGDKAKATAIMGAGVDPHLYKPTRDDVAALMRSDAIFYSGLMLEGKMADTLVKVARGKPVYAVTELIDEKTLLEPEDFGGHYDPHVWMDPSAWAKCVEAVGKALSEFDPPNAATYATNAERLHREVPGAARPTGRRCSPRFPRPAACSSPRTMPSIISAAPSA